MGDIIQFPKNKVKPPKPVTYKSEDVTVDTNNVINIDFSPKIRDATFDETVRELISTIIVGITGEQVPCSCNLSAEVNENGKYVLTNSFIILKDYTTPTNHHYHITEGHLKEAKNFLQQSDVGELTWKEMRKIQGRPTCYTIVLTVELTYIELKSTYGNSADEMIGKNYTIYNPKSAIMLEPDMNISMADDCNLEDPE